MDFSATKELIFILPWSWLSQVVIGRHVRAKLYTKVYEANLLSHQHKLRWTENAVHQMFALQKPINQPKSHWFSKLHYYFGYTQLELHNIVRKPILARWSNRRSRNVSSPEHGLTNSSLNASDIKNNLEHIKYGCATSLPYPYNKSSHHFLGLQMQMWCILPLVSVSISPFRKRSHIIIQTTRWSAHQSKLPRLFMSTLLGGNVYP